MVWRLVLVTIAILAALAPIPPWVVERVYTEGAYPLIQRSLTGISNRTPLSLFDIVCLGVVGWWLLALVRDARARSQTGGWRALRLVLNRTVLIAAVLYLVFLATWGFNYRRPALGPQLGLDQAAVTNDAARQLAVVAIERANALYEQAHASPIAAWDVDPGLADGFAAAQSLLGISRPARPARPKRTLLDAYFRAVGVAGMTAPFLAETLVPSDLLAIERPMVVAHEWSHLAGFADEAEAGFVAWLTCLAGPPAAQYSAWLSFYSDAARVLTRDERRELATRLATGPGDDLRAIADRYARNVRPEMARAGWGVYDRYLRANRVEAGTASYGQALQLALGTELGRRSWQDGETP